MILVLYVNNLLIIGDHFERIEWPKCQLQKRFEVLNLNDMSHYLIIEFVYLEERIFMTQKNYTIKMLEQFGMSNYNPSFIPMVEKTKLQIDMNSPLVDPTFYKQIVRKLYLTNTRLDIMYVVGVVSCFITQLQVPHLEAPKHILWYFQGTTNMGILFKKKGQTIVITYIGSKWAKNMESQRSTKGYVFQLGGTIIT